MVHGGERIERQAARGEDFGGGGGGPTINLQIGMYAGTQTEKREIAMEIWKAIGQIAKSRNVAPAELLNFNQGG
jgi:hypothetical protein